MEDGNPRPSPWLYTSCQTGNGKAEAKSTGISCKNLTGYWDRISGYQTLSAQSLPSFAPPFFVVVLFCLCFFSSFVPALFLACSPLGFCEHV